MAEPGLRETTAGLAVVPVLVVLALVLPAWAVAWLP